MLGKYLLLREYIEVVFLCEYAKIDDFGYAT